MASHVAEFFPEISKTPGDAVLLNRGLLFEPGLRLCKKLARLCKKLARLCFRLALHTGGFL